MAKAFKLPDLGEGIHEGEVLAVLVNVGDEVKEGDPILEVETDKAAVEIPSPYTGSVKEILVKAGDTVKVGDVLMTFSREGEAEIEGEPAVEKKVARVAEPVKCNTIEEGKVSLSVRFKDYLRQQFCQLLEVTLVPFPTPNSHLLLTHVSLPKAGRQDSAIRS